MVQMLSINVCKHEIPALCNKKIDRSYVCSVPFESIIIYLRTLWETALRTVPNIYSRTGVQEGHPGLRRFGVDQIRSGRWETNATNFKTRTRIKLNTLYLRWQSGTMVWPIQTQQDGPWFSSHIMWSEHVVYAGLWCNSVGEWSRKVSGFCLKLVIVNVFPFLPIWIIICV